ncbi:MAG: hypothetical protein J0H83_19100 [Candidatus Melainabacteria bacterium]|jgi:hypothetical protein|nr:hypothetical protein [Candidatus Melainabacteria bacterium]MBX9674099.1 hypothetical protein [Candidatus Obscuribacterales bacterium]
MKLNYKALGALTMLVALGAASTASVMAYDYKDYREDRREAYRDLRKAERRAQRARVYDWNTERSMYGSRWNNMSAWQRRQYDAQMRAQWRAYKGANYNGAYNWNVYNDPGFFDYLHNRQPGLLTNIRNAIGF